MKAGFIGLGIMGKPMAKNLLKAGYLVQVYDHHNESIQEIVACGGVGCKSAREAANGADVIFIMLPNSPQVKTALLDKDGVLETMKKVAIVVDMSSIDPTVSIELEKKITEAGGEMIDAPVSGGEPKAVDGTVSFMCGGKEEVFEKVKPMLEKMGKDVTLVGPIGSGNMTKLANQIIVAVNIAALSEALVLAVKSGVNPENVYKAIRGGLAGSTVMDAKAPMILDRNFQPGFRIELHIKDLNNAVNAAKTVGMNIPMAEKVLGMMKHLQEEGLGKCDHSAVVRYYEEQEEVEVKR